MNLKAMSLQALLVLAGEVIQELKVREIVRGNNKPIGDVAEYIVLKARGGRLMPNSTKSHDVEDSSGTKIQVKAREVKGLTSKFSAFRSFDFDTVVLVVFQPSTFELAWAREVTVEEIRKVAKHQKWTNAFDVRPKDVEFLGRDVLPEMTLAYKSI